MKRIISLVIALSMLISTNCVFAATTLNVPVSAKIPSSLDLGGWIQKHAPGTDPYSAGSTEVTAMDFGTLTFNTTNHIWLPDSMFTVFLTATTSGRAYTITQTNGGVTSGGNNLNPNILVTPDYQSKDTLGGVEQGIKPAGDTLGAKALSFGTNKPVYDSNSGETRIVRAYYGVATGDPAASEPAGSAPITAAKPAGTYAGTVTFSLTLK